ncbi:hemerythrin domain-containing protein [Phycicoccus sonneratiae]|uniref:Hemerythrin domain-containing protein n=1 Tax=Phycicoccus sonneratiae TaxID=2807628 RepID=A0ABS2CLE2_9MICO|nr:hemerythrin domain-containing protein [Phycicoccus sonneraticus]MBM6400600.1 hemerythrin domain-containing protein [Phycicoccus sonneraticus]
MHHDSTVLQHPHQLDLPGQSHVAEGPHDQTGMYVMHHALRRDLDAFRRAVPRTPTGDSSTWQALHTRWVRFAAVLHHHHTAEDEAYWPLLAAAVAERGSDEDRAEVAAMADEHAGIDPELEACGAAFAALRDHPCDAHRNALDVRVAGLQELLLEHLAHEEGVVLPMLQRVWTVEEFAAAEKGVQEYYPLKEAPFLVGWALYGLPEEGRRRMVALAGPVYSVIHALVRGRFARGERRTFRYADAP